MQTGRLAGESFIGTFHRERSRIGLGEILNMPADVQPQSSANRWPPQIKYIVGNEACERFSYYGMKGILAGYITGKVVNGGLGQTDDTSTEIMHYFTFVNYFMPLFGAWLSDKIIGRYHTILWVSLFYCAGHGVLAFSDHAGGVHGKMICLFVGLALIAFGSGGIKPCVSAFMGDQFKPDQGHLLQKAYGAFYWSINFGSFFAFLVIPWVKDKHGYGPAFAVPGVLMAIATFIFWLGTKYYVRIPPARHTGHAGYFEVFFAALRAAPEHRSAGWLNLTATLILPTLAMILMASLAFLGNGLLMKTIGWTSLSLIALWYLLVLVLSVARKTELPEAFWQSVAKAHDEKEIDSARSFNPILFVFALVPVFWCLFEQTNSTWVLQGQKMAEYTFPQFTFITLDGISQWLHGAARSPFQAVIWKVGAEQMQSMNAALVMILVPLFTLGIYPYIGRFAAPLKRMSYGMFFASISYLVVAALQTRIEHGVQISVLWQTVPYVILTSAEVLISTTGLEFAFREAAPSMKSLIMSFWLLTIAFGDLTIAVITKLFSNGAGDASVSTGRFLQYAGLTFVVAILFTIVASFYRYRDEAAARGK
jgi:POT family proton-dependent oligopeptide transporter